MNPLQSMRMFCCLVEARGFSAAAERLDMSHSTVSRQLKQLEASVGVQLVNRNTRRFALTAAGERYYQYSVDILARVEAMSLAMTDERQHLAGALRVSVPLAIGTLELQDWLPAFRERFPDIALEMSCSDQFVDLVAGGFDVALRISSAPLADSSLMAKVLTVSDTVLVASPGYLAQHGAPESVEDLSNHRLLVFTGAASTGEWTLVDHHGKTERVAVRGALSSDAIPALHAAALAGAGIAAFTAHTAHAEIARGALVRVLPQHRIGTSHYYALYPHTRHLTPRARAFIDFMAGHYAGRSSPPADDPVFSSAAAGV
ncbi:LysR family transcriptional regulator [Cupriavidus pauculus]|uniref:LysR family transcriptional regulator n=1 Tax=Cupriavidus pauculus TaxID=82633 RepID=UPI000782090F|nr:LysR family transcriptional regulator [Cupriavidus pauculus]MBY4732371.1 LysR family transcriptional regulator [Cupriavidus pauculus]